MSLYLLVGLSLLFALRALAGWRRGVALMIILAAAQDPLRKLVPGTPGWLVLASVPVFAAMLVSCMLRTRRFWGDFRLAYPHIANSMLLLAALAVPAAWLSASYGEGSWMMTVIGAFSYSVIFLAIMAGFHYPRRLPDLRGLLAIYCITHGLMLTGSILEYLEWFKGSSILGSQALGFEWVRRHDGYAVEMIAGFYRSPDVMGWHAAAVSMLTIILAQASKGRRRFGWSLLCILALSALLLCGRRKMVYMVPVFLVSLGWIYWQAGKSSRVLALIGLILLPVGAAWLIGDRIGEDTSNITYYNQGADETLDRIEHHGFASAVMTVKLNGFFGAGLGVATPGVHHLDVDRPNAMQESGTSRVLVELGVLGAFGMLLVMAAIALGAWKATIERLRAHSPTGTYAAGLFAFFLANVGSLVVSGQILADPFIASFLGLLVGLNLSVIRLQLAERHPNEAQRPRELRPAVDGSRAFS